jgi:hypothetical protein
MSGGKACGKQAAHYTGEKPNEGNVVTSRDTPAPEIEVHSSGLLADAFAAALEAIPAEDCLPACLPADRTIMLRMASKRVREVVDKARLPAVVRLSRSFWDDARNCTAAEKLELVMRQLALATARAASAHSSCRAVK